MQACDLAELSGLIAVSGASFLQGPRRLSDSGLRQYWMASKRRFEQWMRALPNDRWAVASLSSEPRRLQLTPVLEEIFASELLTRVWTAQVCQYERRQDTTGSVAIAWSVLFSHLDARHRALQLLCEAPEQDRHAWAEVDKFRRRCEHWTDLLLAHLVPHGAAEAEAMAFNAERMHDFAEDLGDLRRVRRGENAWQLFQASLKAAFQGDDEVNSPNADLNDQIAAGILASFPPDLFDSTGALHSLWQVRIEHGTEDTLNMVDDLLASTR